MEEKINHIVKNIKYLTINNYLIFLFYIMADMDSYALHGILNNTVNRMRDNSDRKQEYKKGKRLISELKDARNKAQRRMTRRLRLLPSGTRLPGNQWMNGED